MIDVMAKIRAIFVIDEDIRDALKIESTLSGKDMSELLEDYVREKCPDALRQVQQRRAAPKDKKQK